jgi:acyl-CoA thioesterase
MKGARSAQQTAEACGARMYELDDAARALGVVLDEISPGRSRMSMTVREDMVNSHGICHGGMIFSLADCAFAYSCNSYNRTTVAAGATIDYVSPAHLGDRLTAIAEERATSGRTGIYDVRVADQDGKSIACFRGRSYRGEGEIVPGLEESADSEARAAPKRTEQRMKG